MARPAVLLSIAALAATLCLTGPSTAFADEGSVEPQFNEELSRQGAAARAAAEELKQVVATANGRIVQLTAQRNAAVAEVDFLGKAIELAEQSLVVATAELDETRSAIANLARDIEAQNARLEERLAAYAIHLRTTYRSSQISPLEMILSSRSLADFSTRLQSMLIVGREDTRRAQEIRSLRANLEMKRTAAAQKEAELQAALPRIAAQREELVEQRTAFAQVVNRAVAAVSIAQVARDDAATEREHALASAARADSAARALAIAFEQAEGLSPDLAATLAATSGLGLFGSESLPQWPVKDGIVSSGFGARGHGFHNGVDIAAPLYTPVLAAADGIVVTVGHPYLSSGDTAEVVIIAHGKDLSTLYGHLDDLVHLPPVKLGQHVKAGDVIGYVGMTGLTSGPHLHFMTVFNGKALNPGHMFPELDSRPR